MKLVTRHFQSYHHELVATQYWLYRSGELRLAASRKWRDAPLLAGDCSCDPLQHRP